MWSVGPSPKTQDFSWTRTYRSVIVASKRRARRNESSPLHHQRVS